MHTTIDATIGAPPIQAPVLTRHAKLAALLALMLFTGVLALAFNTDGFYVYDLEITGSRFLTKPEIERASGVYGYSIFFVDTASVEKSLKRLPEIKDARVRAGIFNRVVVEIEERQPALTWMRGNEAYWVDAEGVVFAARTNLADLPVLRDLDSAAIKVGQTAPAKAFGAYRALRDAMPDAPRLLEWSNARGVAFTDERGWKIYLGDANEMLGKVAVLRVLIAQLRAQNARIKFVDVGQGDPFYQ